MSEEEKEAIELLKQEPDFSLSYYKREHAIDIVLKLIDKQQEKIKSLESQLDFIGEQNKHINKLQKEIKELKERNQELDKMEFVITNTLPPDMKYNVFCSSDFKRLFGNDYISKEKIREKIKDLEERLKKYYANSEKDVYYNNEYVMSLKFARNELENLLEEE